MSKKYSDLRSQYSNILAKISKCTIQGNRAQINELVQQKDEIIKQMQEYLLERNNGAEMVKLQVNHLTIPNPASIRSNDYEVLNAIDGALDYYDRQKIRDDINNRIRGGL